MIDSFDRSDHSSGLALIDEKLSASFPHLDLAT